MDTPKDKDLREALRRYEQKRELPEVPSGFCDNIMQRIEDDEHGKTIVPPSTDTPSIIHRRSLIAIALSVAALLALLFILPWQKPRHEKDIPTESPITKAIEQNHPSHLQPTTGDKKTNHSGRVVRGDSQNDATHPHNIRISHQQIQPSTNTQLAQLDEKAIHPQLPTQDDSLSLTLYSSFKNNIDSLQYYIDKIERELAHVDESLYIERMNKVIQADERLQRIVNQFILNRITSDDKPQTVHTSNPQNQENHEQ